MKNILYKLSFVFLLAGTFSSCSTYADDLLYDEVGVENPSVGQHYFNPPTWIQGKWKDDLTRYDYFYDFLRNDFREKLNDSMIKSYNALILESLDIPNQALSVEEIVISDSIYEFKLMSEVGSNVHYHFKKVDNNNMIQTYITVEGAPNVESAFERVL